jgi:hypothetical protein
MRTFGKARLAWLAADVAAWNRLKACIRYFESDDRELAEAIADPFQEDQFSPTWSVEIEKKQSYVPEFRKGQTRIFIASQDQQLSRKVMDIFNDHFLKEERAALDSPSQLPMTDNGLVSVLISVYPREKL